MLVHYYGWWKGLLPYMLLPYFGDYRDYCQFIASTWMVPGTVDITQ